MYPHRCSFLTPTVGYIRFAVAEQAELQNFSLECFRDSCLYIAWSCLLDGLEIRFQMLVVTLALQSEGPIYTMDEWATYFASPTPRKPLLNVVSLDLANTKLHDLVWLLSLSPSTSPIGGQQHANLRDGSCLRWVRWFAIRQTACP